MRPGRAEKPGEAERGRVGPSEAESVASNRTDAEASLNFWAPPQRGRRIITDMISYSAIRFSRASRTCMCSFQGCPVGAGDRIDPVVVYFASIVAGTRCVFCSTKHLHQGHWQISEISIEQKLEIVAGIECSWVP